MVRGLSAEARRVLADHNITTNDWARAHGDIDEWRGDRCGCTDDRCIGYHHDAGEECGCLPVLIKTYIAKREAAVIWAEYRKANEVGDGETYFLMWHRAKMWVQENYPAATSLSLDTVVTGHRGISITYPLKPGQEVPEWATPDERGYRILVWAE